MEGLAVVLLASDTFNGLVPDTETDMAAPDFDYIAVEEGGRAVAHVFVAPQELKGLDIGYVELDEEEEEDEEGPSVAGDVYIGNETDGYFTLDFELSADGNTLLLGDYEYKLRRGRCFLVKEGYEVVQLHCQTKDEAERYLAKQKR
jgi:hypothetical protein